MANNILDKPAMEAILELREAFLGIRNEQADMELRLASQLSKGLLELQRNQTNFMKSLADTREDLISSMARSGERIARMEAKIDNVCEDTVQAQQDRTVLRTIIDSHTQKFAVIEERTGQMARLSSILASIFGTIGGAATAVIAWLVGGS